MSPELRAMLDEQDKLGGRIDIEMDLLELVLWCDSVDTTKGLGTAIPGLTFKEESKCQ